MAGARKAVRRHPLLRERPKGAWYPDLVGVVRGYPKTQEEWQRRSDLMRQQVRLYNAEGIATRKGVPDGWAGRKAEAQAAREDAHDKAERIYQSMVDKDLIDVDTGVDADRAELAMKQAVRFMVDPTVGERERFAALKIVLEYTKAKPAQKSEVKLEKAEDFLASLIGDA